MDDVPDGGTLLVPSSAFRFNTILIHTLSRCSCGLYIVEPAVFFRRVFKNFALDSALVSPGKNAATHYPLKTRM